MGQPSHSNSGSIASGSKHPRAQTSTTDLQVFHSLIQCESFLYSLKTTSLSLRYCSYQAMKSS